MNTATLKKYASDLCEALLLGRYKGAGFKGGKELFFDLAVLSYLRAKGYSVQRQVPQRFAGKNGRIDFRVGPQNPVFIEFACRTNQEKTSLHAIYNRSEIDKLSRISNQSRGRRCLLLLDLAKYPILRKKLEPSYRKIAFKGPQRNRHPVTIVYGHADIAYSFRWKKRSRIG